MLVLAVAGTWWLAYHVNAAVFQNLGYSERASWVFLPAALRVIAVLLLDNIGVAGLVLGAYFTLPHTPSTTWIGEAGLSVSSGVAPLIAVSMCRRLLHLNGNLAGLRPWHILALSASSALANSIVLTAYLEIMAQNAYSFRQALVILVGDITGSAITLLTLSTTLNLIASTAILKVRNR